MGRADVARRGPLDPASWPLWVLAFGKGYFPDDPVRQAARRIEFHQWQQARDAWFVDNDIPYSWMQVHRERRRRGDAWLADHPEDRGPAFHRAGNA